MLNIDTIEKAMTDLYQAGRIMPYNLLLPSHLKRRKVGTIFGMDVIADPMVPKDKWYIESRGYRDGVANPAKRSIR